MPETEHLGMKIQASGTGAIKAVAKNGDSQTCSMGTMHPQLMGAPRMGEECHTGVAIVHAKHLIGGDGLLALLHIDLLIGAVEGIGIQRQTHLTLRLTGKEPLQQSHITFLH